MARAISLVARSVVQKTIKRFLNIGFALLVIVVLLLTALAVTYQPPDPWQDTGNALNNVLNSVRNATFITDDSVIQTGEDFSVSVNESLSNGALDHSQKTTVVESVVETVMMAGVSNVSCDDGYGFAQESGTINCSLPGVLAAIKDYNLEHLRNLEFFFYLTPVRGKALDECDVAWRYRAKREKSWRTYRDFRRYSLAFNHTNCNYVVHKAEGWHSGKNARFSPQIDVNQKSDRDKKSTTISNELDSVNDEIPLIDSENSVFRNRKYLIYSKSGDYCKNMNQYLWSFLCALGEAQYLNRTLVMDLNVCLSGLHDPARGDQHDKDFRFYFDFAHLNDASSVMEAKQFYKDLEQWNLHHSSQKLQIKEIKDFKMTPMQLQKEDNAILYRTFNEPEPDNYWFRVCEGEAEHVIQRPWHLLWKSKRIMDIVNAICGQMEWDFDSVHVVRGEKASSKDLWPHLDADTSVDSLIEKLKNEIDVSRRIYVATNEKDPMYFVRLKQVYSHAYSLDDFSDLWTVGSAWYNQSMELNGGLPVEFDGYMRAEVDTEVTYRAKKKLETFGFLTNDCKDGVGTC